MKELTKRSYKSLILNKDKFQVKEEEPEVVKEIGRTYYILSVLTKENAELFKPDIFEFVDQYLKRRGIRATVDANPQVLPEDEEGNLVIPSTNQTKHVDHFRFVFKCPEKG